MSPSEQGAEDNIGPSLAKVVREQVLLCRDVTLCYSRKKAMAQMMQAWYRGEVPPIYIQYCLPRSSHHSKSPIISWSTTSDISS
jgi:hypothetical protein